MTDLPSLFRLDDLVAVVTGGGRGLGLTMAQALAQAGAAVAIFEVDEQTGAAAAQSIADGGGRALALTVDVGNGEQVEAAFDHCADQLGQASILVNNAGVTTNAPFDQLPAEDWQRVIDINLGGIYRTTQALGRRLIAAGRPGSIVNIASISGLVGNRGGNTAGEGGIWMTNSLAPEPAGIGSAQLLRARTVAARDQPPDRRGRAAGHAADGLLAQHFPRGGRRYGGPGASP